MPAPKNAAQPKDHLKSKAERENEPFEWEHDGQVFTLPPGGKIKAGVMRKASKQAGDLAQVFIILEEIATPDTMKVIDDMDIDDLGEMFLAWQKHSGASLGESQGSST